MPPDPIAGLREFIMQKDQALLEQTNATLVLTHVQPADAGSYSVAVAHLLPWGELGVTSSNAVLRVEPPR